MNEQASPMDADYSPAHRKLYVFDTHARMERDGCEAALTPCFVTHTFIGELANEFGIRLISMTDAVRAAVDALSSRPKVIGVIATPYVRNGGLFDRLLAAEGAEAILLGCAKPPLILRETDASGGAPVDFATPHIRQFIRFLGLGEAEIVDANKGEAISA